MIEAVIKFIVSVWLLLIIVPIVLGVIVLVCSNFFKIFTLAFWGIYKLPRRRQSSKADNARRRKIQKNT